jgi:arginine deiminase
MAKLKVFNRNKFDIGVKLINPIREQNIKAGSFSILEEDDIYYLDTICTLFKRGMLVVEDKQVVENLGIVEVHENSKTDEEIIAILKGNFLKMKSELAKIREPHLIDAVYNIAKSIGGELSGSKLKYLAEFCGKEILINEIED